MKPYNPPVLEIGKYTFERKKYLMPKFLTFAQADIILAKSHQLPFLDELKEKMDNEIKEISDRAADKNWRGTPWGNKSTIGWGIRIF